MQQDLWRLRQQKRWTINELAAQSGVPGLSIHEYEQGRPIRALDLPKLAAALGVEVGAIKEQSAAKPRQERPAGRPARKRPAGPKPQPETKPARPSQVTHLVALGVKLGKTQPDVEAEIGQPLENLNRREIGKWLAQYTARIKERKEEISGDPSGTKRWRAHLPEGVDSFELEYLTRQKEAQSQLTFHLFDGQSLTGRIIGFSPYNITIRTEDDQETTIQKLAIAYYSLSAEQGGGS